jgi:hypothetical protein
MLFKGASDVALRRVTGDFPATLCPDRKTHPLYVLHILPALGHKVCPCSSKNWNAARCIRSGCTLLYTGRQTDRVSYLVESFSFNLPSDPEFVRHLRFQGRVPADCVQPCPSR